MVSACTGGQLIAWESVVTLTSMKQRILYWSLESICMWDKQKRHYRLKILRLIMITMHNNNTHLPCYGAPKSYGLHMGTFISTCTWRQRLLCSIEDSHVTYSNNFHSFDDDITKGSTTSRSTWAARHLHTSPNTSYIFQWST